MQHLPALVGTAGHHVHPSSSTRAQVLSFDLSTAAPAPTVFDLTSIVAGVPFQARAVRVISASAATTMLLVGGVDTTYPTRPYSGVLIHGSVAAGSAVFNMLGSVVLPSFGAGVTALSQTTLLHPGFVLASTDRGVFKCVGAQPLHPRDVCMCACLPVCLCRPVSP